jgi:fluoride ion exporter CrcB/FEX
MYSIGWRRNRKKNTFMARDVIVRWWGDVIRQNPPLSTSIVNALSSNCLLLTFAILREQTRASNTLATN